MLVQTSGQKPVVGKEGTEGSRKRGHHQWQQTTGSVSGVLCNFTVTDFALNSNFRICQRARPGAGELFLPCSSRLSSDPWTVYLPLLLVLTHLRF